MMSEPEPSVYRPDLISMSLSSEPISAHFNNSISQEGVASRAVHVMTNSVKWSCMINIKSSSAKVTPYC